MNYTPPPAAAKGTPPPPPSNTPPPPPKGIAGTRPAADRENRPKIVRGTPQAFGERIVLTAVEGWGKTTVAAFAPDPLLVMEHEETGYYTLLRNQRVPSIDTVTAASWQDLLDVCDDVLAMEPIPYRNIAFDALGGIETFLHQHVCTREFGGDFGPKGFLAYHKGYDVAVRDLQHWISRLDQMHRRGVNVILLSHVVAKQAPNPIGEDILRYQSDVHPKTWAAIHGWADAVLFGTFYSVPKGKDGADAHKGVGGDERVLYTQNADAYLAKNRHGMERMIRFPANPAQMWDCIWSDITKNRV